MWISKPAWDAVQASLGIERARVQYYQEKCDRLTEALLKKDTQTIVRLPAAPLTPAPNVPVVLGPNSVEHPDTWSSKHGWFGEQKIATPPIPNKKEN